MANHGGISLISLRSALLVRHLFNIEVFTPPILTHFDAPNKRFTCSKEKEKMKQMRGGNFLKRRFTGYKWLARAPLGFMFSDNDLISLSIHLPDSLNLSPLVLVSAALSKMSFLIFLFLNYFFCFFCSFPHPPKKKKICRFPHPSIESYMRKAKQFNRENIFEETIDNSWCVNCLFADDANY